MKNSLNQLFTILSPYRGDFGGLYLHFNKIVLSIVLCFFGSLVSAQIALPKFFGDSMVLQRNIRIPIWGTAAPGTQIVAQLGYSIVHVKTDKTGKWMAHFPKFNAGGPYTLKISEVGKPEVQILLKGILIGDVWLASGQSNMDWQVQQAQDSQNEIAKANYPQLRFIIVGQDVKLTPQNDILSGNWKVCNPMNVKDFSAVAYYFSRKIHMDQNVPIGIIQTTRGGTPIESWTSREKLLSSPISRGRTLSNDTLTPMHFVKDSLNWIRLWDIVYHPKNNTEKIIPSTDYDDSEWSAVEMPKQIKDFGIGAYEGIVWMRKKVVLPDDFNGKDLMLNIGHPEMNYSFYFNGVEICKTVWNSNPKRSYTIPASILRKGENTISIRIAMLWGGGGINPPKEELYLTDGISKLALAGTWLYQKDLEFAFPKIQNYQYYPAVLYNAMLHSLIPFGIKGFIWYQGEANDSAAYNYRKLFPMMITDWRKRWGQGNLPFLYVQLANFRKIQTVPIESDWAELREAQTMTLSQPNTGMACIIDVGDSESIHPLNKQEVGRRLALIANKQVYHQKCIAYGPKFNGFSNKGRKIYIRFSNTEGGLKTSDGKYVSGFSIAGDDKKFYWAEATIKGDVVEVYSDMVSNPKAVRYAWADNPICNLVNSYGLPAIPFRTDGWKKTSK